jgi:hypothetical protein
MNENEYVDQRVQDQIDWYDRKSRAAKGWFRRLRVIEIVAAATIPLLVSYSDWSLYVKVTVGILGIMVAVIAGLLSLHQFQENWIDYRATCESLRHEKFLFITRTGPYDGERPFPLFVQRIESLISKETSGWAQATRSSGKRRAENQEPPESGNVAG